MIKKIVLFIAVILGFVYLRLWFPCSHLADRFYYSRLDMQLRLNDVINNDTGAPFLVIHAFHNKLVQTIIDTSKEYILFWDPGFLIHLLSFVGFFGLLYGVYELGVKKRGRKPLVIWLVLAGVIQLWILSPIPNPFTLSMEILAVLYQIVAFYGLWKFLEKKQWYVLLVLVLLILLSLAWIFILPQNVYTYCIKG